MTINKILKLLFLWEILKLLFLRFIGYSTNNYSTAGGASPN
jgi:hypothetical protein